MYDVECLLCCFSIYSIPFIISLINFCLLKSVIMQVMVYSCAVQLKCCGVYNYTSWGQTEYFKQYGIPKSCCMSLTNCTAENLKDLNLARTVVYQQVRLQPPVSEHGPNKTFVILKSVPPGFCNHRN